MHSYVLITPAHNEEAFIEQTFRSVLRQTRRPKKWVVVNDASTDQTGVILDRCAAQCPDWMEVVHLERPDGRDFGNKVRAFNAGLARTAGLNYAYIGNLDADITLPQNYYESMLAEFDWDPSLGIAGGMISTCIEGRYVSQRVSLDSVAGAVQLFRRACFHDIGGYLVLPAGGIDAAAEIMARKEGWTVRTFPELTVLEHRRTGSATANPLTARVKEGRRLYSLGYGFTFFLMRCVRRATERPRVVGSIAALYGYLQAKSRGDPIALPAPVVSHLRREQRQKLLLALRQVTSLERL